MEYMFMSSRMFVVLLITSLTLSQASFANFDSSSSSSCKRGPRGPTGHTGPHGKDNHKLGPTGPTGPMGVQGFTGTPGMAEVTGDTGATGPNGLTGPTGTRGTTGATGPTGSNGSTGNTGATGTVLTFGYFYTFNTELVLANANVLFINPGPVGPGIANNPVTGEITITVPGTYFAEYFTTFQAQITENGALSLLGKPNGGSTAPIPGSSMGINYFPLLSDFTGIPVFQLRGQAIFTIEAADVPYILTLTNATNHNIILFGAALASDDTATITITQLE